jgi:hypothetical protein
MADSSNPFVPFTVNNSTPTATTSGNSFNFVANLQNNQTNTSTSSLIGLSSSTALSTGITGDVTNSVSAYNANTVAASQGTQILNNAASPNWVGNVLSGYQNPTYHIKFWMTQDKPLTTSTFTSWAQARAAIDALPTTIIAESGVTGIVVDSLTIDSIPAPNNVTRSVAATNFTLVIKEPMGASFLDLLAQTAQDLSINNYYKTFYFIEVSFKGYDDQGNIVNNICNAFPNGGKWLYQIGIKNIEVETTAAGSTYTITAIPYEEDVYSAYSLYTTAAFTPQGSTLGDILTNLGQQMTQEDIVLEGYAVNTWNFQVAQFVKDGKTYNPATWAVNSTNININFADLSNQGMDFTNVDQTSTATGTGVRGYFPKGMKVTDIIEVLFMCCPDAQMIAKDVNAPNQLDKDNVSFRNCFLFRHEPSVQLSGYDTVKNQYTKTITFTSLAYFTNKPILSQNDVAASQVSTNQVNQVNIYANSGYLTKRYDYMFTGLNTEVLDYNIKFNLNWTALLPNIYAYTSTTAAVVDQTMAKSPAQQAVALQQQLADDQATLNSTQQAIAASAQQIALDNAQLQTLQAQANANGGTYNPTQQTTVNSLNADIANQQALSSTLQATQNSYVGKVAADQSALGNSSANVTKLGTTTSSVNPPAYAEDELTNVVKQRVPISTKQSIPDDEQGALSKQYTVDRSIYGAILNQVHGVVENDLSNIGLTIKGDPYWLGSGNLERLVGHSITFSTPRNNMGQNVVGNMQPDYTYGDIMFLMSFKYSLGTNSNGTPIINQNQNFTGIYAAKRIIHTFQNGLFTQDVTGIRQTLIDAFQALGLQTGSTTSGTSSVTTANSQSALSQWTLNGQPGASQTSVSKLSS